MRNCSFQGSGKGVTLGGNDRRHCRRIYNLSQKANAKTIKAESTKKGKNG